MTADPRQIAYAAHRKAWADENNPLSPAKIKGADWLARKKVSDPKKEEDE